MPLADWLDKYPQVKRLLDEGAEVLEYDVDGEAAQDVHEPREPFARLEEEYRRVEASILHRYTMDLPPREEPATAVDDAAYRASIREAASGVQQELQDIQAAQEAHLLAMVDAFRIDCATGADLDALAADYGLSRRAVPPPESPPSPDEPSSIPPSAPVFVLTGPMLDVAEARRVRMARWGEDHPEGEVET